jgi:hypothetical protein
MAGRKETQVTNRRCYGLQIVIFFGIEVKAVTWAERISEKAGSQ